MNPLILASSSAIRATLLRNAGVPVEVQPARIDESSLTASLQAEGATPHDIADALAEHKALRIAARNPSRLVLGCDQLLECDGTLYAKPESPAQAADQLRRLRGRTHRLHTAAVLFHDGQPIWRHVATPRLTMRAFSDAFLAGYLQRNWDSIRHCVGGYQIESEGIRLFSSIEGDLFAIQGLPLLPLLDILMTRQEIDG
jgi:septum formation protein